MMASSDNFHYVYTAEDAVDTGALVSSRESYSWTDDKALQLIRLRIQYKELFTRKKGSATLGYKKIAENLNLGQANYPCVKKKWENMVDKFRQEIKKIINTENESQPCIKSTWKFYDAMSNALGLERERSRVKLSMMVIDSSGFHHQQQTNHATLNANALADNESSIIQANTNTIIPPPICSDPLPTFKTSEIKIEANEFEFDKIFIEEEQQDESMLQCTPIDNLLTKSNTTYGDDTQHAVYQMSNDSTAPHVRSILNSSTCVASTSTPQVYPKTAVQVHSAAMSDVVSSCSSHHTPNDNDSRSRQGRKRRSSHLDDEDIWEYIKQGDEEIRNDFKQLIEIQRKTSEHIGALVNYLINKDKI